MIIQFLDVGKSSFHDQFQSWRTKHQDGVFLTLQTRTRANLHGARCQHLGRGPAYFVLKDGFGSLTRKRKICGPRGELLAWAARNGIDVTPCRHCQRDKLIGNIHSAKARPSKQSTRRRRSRRFWMCHWQFRYWRPEVNREGEPVRSSASNGFRKRGVSPGDIIYVVSLAEGQLYLGGRMTVKAIVSRREAVRLWKTDRLYDAKEWAVDPKKTGTPLHLCRRLSPVLTKQLQLMSKTGPRGLSFVTDKELDRQATRGVPELTPESAALFDRIIEMTDRLPRSTQLLTVTEKLLGNKAALYGGEEIGLPEDVPVGATYAEGSPEQILTNRYERDPRARRACIRHYGTRCFICGFDSTAVYGKAVTGLIHVHHLEQLSNVGAGYRVDPIQDLRPVCPNCHAVLHWRQPAFSLEEVRRLLRRQFGNGPIRRQF